MKKVFTIVILLAVLNQQSIAQWRINSKTNMPKATTNCATTAHGNNVYIFGSIDSNLTYNSIHQRCYKYNCITDAYTALPDMPDTLGKIAAGASVVKNIAYIIGGYYVYANGNEASSNRVHRFNTVADTFLSDGTNIPIAIDDQVQAVWRDSLIYVVTGWSNTSNVPNVQVYNPATDIWQAGASTLNTNIYRCFGGSGIIVADTIYYFGGAAMGNNFPITNFLRKGIIDPNNPTNITWSYETIPNIYGYRMAAVYDSATKQIAFVGGSKKSYNYNGLAYDGSGLAPSNQFALVYKGSGNFYKDSFAASNFLRDYRTVGRCANNKWYLAGGINDAGVAADKMLELHYEIPAQLTNMKDPPKISLAKISDNSFVIKSHEEVVNATMTDIIGNKLPLQKNHNMWQYSATTGLYFVQAYTKNGVQILSFINQ
jgi:hypothetical protein